MAMHRLKWTEMLELIIFVNFCRLFKGRVSLGYPYVPESNRLVG